MSDAPANPPPSASAASLCASRLRGPARRLRSDVGGDETLGLDAKGGFEFGGSIDHGVSFGECGATRA
jgi:hypothetical protein